MLYSFLTNIEYIIITAVDILGSFFVFWILFNRKKEKSNLGLSLMVTFILSWITFYYVASLPTINELSLVFFRISGASVFLFFVAYYFFIVRWFLGKEGYYKILGKIIFVYGLTLATLTIFTRFIIKSPAFDKNGTIFPLFSQGGEFAFYGYVILLTILINVILVKNYISSPKVNKLKIQYFLVGMILFATLNFIFNVILPIFGTNYSYCQLGNYSTLFLIGFTAYAIIKQNLFGIKVVLTQILVMAIAILLFANFLVSQTTFEYIWKGGLFIIFCLFGWLLIKSVKKEIQQKEQLNQYAADMAKANAELQVAYAKLETLDKAKSEFVSIASHQLRTPLTAIKGYISMVIEGDYGKISKEAMQIMKNVYLANERLIKLVNSLLDMSRLEAGKITLEFSPVKVDDLVADILRELRAEAENKNLKLKLVKDKIALPKIQADPVKLRDALMNLVDNAIKYTNRGEVMVKIKFIADNKKMEIVVQDTGEGMTQEEIDKLFQSFSRADSGRKNWSEGSGLGLYIAKKFVEMHHGEIWAESQGKGLGSRFVIELPISQVK